MAFWKAVIIAASALAIAVPLVHADGPQAHSFTCNDTTIAGDPQTWLNTDAWGFNADGPHSNSTRTHSLVLGSFGYADPTTGAWTNPFDHNPQIDARHLVYVWIRAGANGNLTGPTMDVVPDTSATPPHYAHFYVESNGVPGFQPYDITCKSSSGVTGVLYKADKVWSQEPLP